MGLDNIHIMGLSHECKGQKGYTNFTKIIKRSLFNL